MTTYSRRKFLKTAAISATGLTVVPNTVLGKTQGYTSASDKLNITGIGVRGTAMNVKAEEMENKEKKVIVICAHPDHRHTSLLVQDAAFLVNVPKILPEIPALEQSPLFLYTRGRYVNPQKSQPDIVVDITPVIREKAYVIDAHASQIYEWLPWINRNNDIIPETQEGKIEYILREYVLKRGEVKEKDKPVVKKWYGNNAEKVTTIEAFEICEFGRTVDDQDIRELFPIFCKYSESRTQ